MIVALNKSELFEITKRGQISTMNKTVKTQNVLEDGTVLKLEEKGGTLLSNIDTTGMSKL